MRPYQHAPGCMTTTYFCVGCEDETCTSCEPSPGEVDLLCSSCWDAEDPGDAA